MSVVFLFLTVGNTVLLKIAIQAWVEFVVPAKTFFQIELFWFSPLQVCLIFCFLLKGIRKVKMAPFLKLANQSASKVAK